MPDLHQLHLLGLALARDSCISLSARSRWSRTERGLRPPLLALAGLDEAPQGLQGYWGAQEVNVRSCGGRAPRRAHLPSAAPWAARGRWASLSATTTASVLDLIEMPDVHELQLFGLA